MRNVVSSSVGKRQRDKEWENSVSLWIPACVCGTAGKLNEKVGPGHKPTNPTSAYSDKSQRNTCDLTEQASMPTAQQIKSSTPLWPKGIKLKSEQENETLQSLHCCQDGGKRKDRKCSRSRKCQRANDKMSYILLVNLWWNMFCVAAGLTCQEA